ncbi:MAG: TraR/DksA family transcriptional regulator [Nocardioidaceae bacterium]
MPKAAKKTAAKPAPATAKRPANKAAAKKAPAKTAAAKKAAAKTAAANKAAAKKAPAKKSAATKAPAKKAAATKAPAKKAATKRTPATKAPARKRASRLVVLPHEKPWTAKELREVRGELEGERQRFFTEISSAERELQDLLRDGGEGAGNDQADVGANSLERDAEMSLANNTREMLFQVERALGRMDDGSYGVCESCGNPIGKMRLMAFPRATLCMTCKQREERR